MQAWWAGLFGCMCVHRAEVHQVCMYSSFLRVRIVGVDAIVAIAVIVVIV